MMWGRGACLLLLFVVLSQGVADESDGWFEAAIVHELSFAVLYPNQTMEGRCVSKGFPLPVVYFINEYYDFDHNPSDVRYTYATLNATFREARMVITDPAYAAYMPMLICETENEIGWHDNIYMPVTHL